MDKKILDPSNIKSQQIADYFNKAQNKNPMYVSSSTTASISNNVESSEFLQAYEVQENRFIPQINFETASNFARYGQAEEYYKDAFTRIYNQYPYDGSQKEKVLWELSSSYIDKYIFDNIYPRTNGHATIGVYQTALTGSPSHSTFRSYNSSTKEYIFIKGGPNADPNGNWKSDIEPGQSIKGLSKTNIYDTASFRESNLKLDLRYGNTVEFWLKKAQWANDDAQLTGSTLGTVEMIFDLWNSSSLENTSSGGDYGRLNVYVRSDTPSKIFTTVQSGSSAARYCNTGDSPFCAGGLETGLGNIADNKWHHYALVTQNSGNLNKTKLYVDGTYTATATSGSSDHIASISAVTGAYIATIGSQVTKILGDNKGDLGWSKLSGSIDEFRFWKTARSSKEIGRFYKDQVYGGSNTDTSNIDLGVYYKFNEGITQTSSADSTVLDYSGRISNGAWTGYSSTDSRSTSSAIVESGHAEKEFKDPIIYSYHPTVVKELETLKTVGREHDYNNGTSLINSLPAWISEDDFANGTGQLNKLTQILASYLDTLHLQIEALPTIRNIDYASGSARPYFFNDRLLKDYGFNVDEILTDIDLFAYANTRDDKKLFEKKLYDVKNQIYKNIYNNLVYIYKSKGTKKSFRNLLRCIGIDEELLRLNLYGNNTNWVLKTNTKNVSSKSKYIDFYNNTNATVFGYPEPGNSNSTSFISGSGNESTGIDSLAPITIQTRITFPKYPSNLSPVEKIYTQHTSSLFGLHTAKTDSTTDTAWATNDSGSIQIYAIRKEKQTVNDNPEVYFLMTGSALGPITSSVFKDVYDNSEWSLNVRVRDAKYPQLDLVSGSDSPVSVIAELIGHQSIGDVITNEFSVTGTLQSAYGSSFFVVPKRLYVGAHKTNFSGSLLQESDVYISYARYWNSFLSDDVLKYHTKNDSSYGVEHPYQNSFLFEGVNSSGLANSGMPSISTLALNWDFSQVTASDSSGQFIVADFSSGSVNSNNYLLSNITERQNTGLGYGFAASSNNVVEKKHISSTRLMAPDLINSDDMVDIVDFESEIFTKKSRPVEYFYAFEKSMYANISDEMLNWFAGIKDFHNLMGMPVIKYRKENKEINKIRELFFQRVDNIPDLDKFIEYFKWIDNSISTMLANLTPATANMSNGVRNMVESHVLERNRIETKYSNLNLKQPEPDGRIKAINELLYNWKFGHGPVSDSQNDNCLFWKDRAERDGGVITSGDSTLDAQRETIKRVVNSVVSGSTYVLRKLTRPYRFEAKRSEDFKIDNIKLNFAKTELNRSNRGASQTIVLQNIENYKNCNDNQALERKRKVDFQANVSGELLKGRTVAPFTIFSSSVATGYKKKLLTFDAKIDINDNHKDVYGTETQEPLQGPFTKIHVGGKKSRKVAPMQTTDRTEDYDLTVNSNNITLSQRSLEDPQAPYFLDEIAKRPVVIKNIKSSTSSVYLGNYSKEYQIVQTVGANTQRGWLKDNFNSVTQITAEVLNLSGNINFNNFDRTGSSLQSVTIADRFSGPGSPEAMSLGYLDPASRTFSVYNNLNYRNMTVRLPRVNFLFTASAFSSGFHPASPFYQFKPFGGNDDERLRTLRTGVPLRSRLAHPMSSEGYDMYLSAPDGSVLTASLHRVNRNFKTRPRLIGGFMINHFSRDNAFVQRAIPRSDRQYTWITASMSASFLGPNVNSVLFGSGQGDSLTAPLGYATSPSDIAFVTASDIGIRGTSAVVDFANLNILVNDPVDPANNLISSSNGNYKLTNITTIPDAEVLTSLINHRQGPYGWPTWKQIRGGNNPIVRNHKKTSTLSILDKRVKVLDQTGNTFKNSNRILNLTESAVTTKFKPFKVNLTVKQDLYNNDLEEVVDLEYTYGNNRCFFANEEIYNAFDSYNFNKINLARKKTSEAYDTITKLYSNDFLGSLSPVKSFNSLSCPEIIWPKRENTFLNRTRTRNNYAEVSGTGANGFDRISNRSFWRNDINDRLRTDLGAFNSQGFALSASNLGPDSTSGTDIIAFRSGSRAAPLSIWPLDGRWTGTYAELSSSFVEGNPYGATPFALETRDKFSGELFGGQTSFQNTYTDGSLLAYDLQWLTASARYHGTDSFMGGQFLPRQGNTAVGTAASASSNIYWTTNADRGRNPWFDSYEEYASDLRMIGKDYSVVPEFNISDHMPYYVVDRGSDFMAPAPKNKFQIPGIHNSSSANTSFFKEYSHSDFLKNFHLVIEDHKIFSDIKNIKLTCHGLKKLLPYNGFYPVNRTLQIATLLSQSFATHISGTQTSVPEGKGAASLYDPDPHAARMAAFLQPFFAPGIMYNTIKSGVAVDWPAYTGSASKSISSATELPTLLYPSNYRLPFEAIYDFSNLPIFNTANPDNKIYAVANNDQNAFFTWDGDSNDDLYIRAINNFLAESVNLFLQDGKLNSWVSKPMSDISFKEGVTYKMSIDLQLAGIRMTEGAKASALGFGDGLGINSNSPQQFINRRGVIYGPASRFFTASNFSSEQPYGEQQDPAYAPYTPPYFYGKSTVDLSYTNTIDDTPQPSLGQILASLTASYSNNLDNIPSASYDTGSAGRGLGYWVADNSAAISTIMNVSSSLNLFGRTILPIVSQTGEDITIQEPSDPTEREQWVISTKFECPVLDFSDYTDDTKASGMWNGYGKLSPGNKGLKITFRDTNPVTQNSYGAENEASLLSLMFPDVKKRKTVGRLPMDNEKSISECVVAIPFFPATHKNLAETYGCIFSKDDNKYFFPILGSEEGQSVKDLKDKMQKFIFPPRYDFVNNENPFLSPFAMFAFEFTHRFSREELQDIWQGVMPDVAAKVISQKSELEIPCQDKEIMGSFWKQLSNFKTSKFTSKNTLDNLRWMIFKVKQRARNRYVNITEDVTDNSLTMLNIDNQSKIKDDTYSYNWPYDYCSLIELVKIENTMEIVSGAEIPISPPTPEPPPPPPENPPDAPEGIPIPLPPQPEGTDY
jgi:hypothetical protein